MSNKELAGMIKKFSKQSQKVIDEKNKKQKKIAMQKQIAGTVGLSIDEQEGLKKYSEPQRQPQNNIFANMWQGEKTHKFLAHLLAAYSPLSLGHFAWTDTELKEDHCCICKHKLVSKEFLLKNFREIGEASLNSLTEDIKSPGQPSSMRKHLHQAIGDVVLGVVSPNSTAAFCDACFKLFGEWFTNQLLMGNQEANRIVHNRMIMEKRLLQEAAKSPFINPLDQMDGFVEALHNPGHEIIKAIEELDQEKANIETEKNQEDGFLEPPIG